MTNLVLCLFSYDLLNLPFHFCFLHLGLFQSGFSIMELLHNMLSSPNSLLTKSNFSCDLELQIILFLDQARTLRNGFVFLLHCVPHYFLIAFWQVLFLFEQFRQQSSVLVNHFQGFLHTIHFSLNLVKFWHVRQFQFLHSFFRWLLGFVHLVQFFLRSLYMPIQVVDHDFQVSDFVGQT